MEYFVVLTTLAGLGDTGRTIKSKENLSRRNNLLLDYSGTEQEKHVIIFIEQACPKT